MKNVYSINANMNVYVLQTSTNTDVFKNASLCIELLVITLVGGGSGGGGCLTVSSGVWS